MIMIAILLSDFYKQCHPAQYDRRIVRLVNYYTPRSTRIADWQSVPVVGIQKWIREELIDNFNENFFHLPLNTVLELYTWIITETLGKDKLDIARITALHKLGYLPLDIRALEEGTLCPIGVPMIEVSNTHDDFAWLVNNIETTELSELWYPMVIARVGMEYRDIANHWYQLTCDHPELAKHAFSGFEYRSMPGREAAIKASLGFLLSFDKTATIPAICNIYKYYGDPLASIAKGMASTEHSVMCSSFAIDGDEITCIKRLLTEVYPDGPFSMVSDSYDYWHLVLELLPEAMKEILDRDGVLYVRGDSGDPVEIVVATVMKLWSIFGGTINSKGFKVLDPHIRAIYGDGITQKRSRQIFQALYDAGFSAENVALGIGGFSMLIRESQCKCGETSYPGFTRDTFGVAIKTTWGEYLKEVHPTKAPEMSKFIREGFNIFKDPKTDENKLKRSQKGCCVVFDDSGTIRYDDGFDIDIAHHPRTTNLLKPLFLDGQLLRETTYNEVRNRLWNNQF